MGRMSGFSRQSLKEKFSEHVESQELEVMLDEIFGISDGRFNRVKEGFLRGLKGVNIDDTATLEVLDELGKIK